MVQVIYPKYPGLFFICKNCGAIVRYEVNDVYGQFVYCPQCRMPNEVQLDKEYDGVVKEEK